MGAIASAKLHAIGLSSLAFTFNLLKIYRLSSAGWCNTVKQSALPIAQLRFKLDKTGLLQSYVGKQKHSCASYCCHMTVFLMLCQANGSTNFHLNPVNRNTVMWQLVADSHDSHSSSNS